MLHSDVFRAAVSMSGYYHTLEDPTTGNLWGGSQVLRNLNSPEWLLAAPAAATGLGARSIVSSQERGLGGLSDTRWFLSLVRPPMTASSIVVPGGGHNYANWAGVLPTGFRLAVSPPRTPC